MNLLKEDLYYTTRGSYGLDDNGKMLVLDHHNGNGGLLGYLPTLEAVDYYMQPSFEELAARERVDPGYCSRVLDFTVGRFGYGAVKYPGETDVRCLELDKIVKFNRHEVIVYEDESAKPFVGRGLNKPAEVTLMLQTRLPCVDQRQIEHIVKILRHSVEGQGAHFVSFNPENGEWKFFVNHFSRFGLIDEDEEDMMMEDTDVGEDPPELNHDEMFDEGNQMDRTGTVLLHSLPAHLGLDPIKMQEMRMWMFSDAEEEAEDFKESPSHYNPSFGKDYSRSPLQNAQRISHRSSPPAVRKIPLALLEYKHGSFDSNSPGAILMAQENKALPLKTLKEGFKLDLSRDTPVTRKDSCNIVDAGLFMGRSFRVGWGPNGVLVHAGAPIGSSGSQRVLSSVINIEKVAIDNVVRDESNKVRAELVETTITSPLELHKGLYHETKEVEIGSFSLRLQKLVSNQFMLSDICRSYVDNIERQLEVPGLSSSACLVLTHQIMIWELIKVLFSERENGGKLESYGVDAEEGGVEVVINEGVRRWYKNTSPDWNSSFGRKFKMVAAAAEPLTNPLQKQASSEDMRNFMEKVKRKIGEEKYQSFLDVVGEYQDKQTGIHKLLEQMSVLLSDEPNLTKELNHLLPDGISMLKVERKPSGIVPKPRSRWLSGFRYVFVGGLGITLGIWAHLLF